MKRPAILLFVIFILTGLGVWWFSPGQVLKRKTLSLLSTLTMESGVGTVSRQTGAYSLNAILAQEVELDTPTIKEANGTFERSELESAYSWLSSQAKQTRFEARDFRNIKVNGKEATVELRLTGLVELPNYRPADGDYDVVFLWRQEKDGWRLYKATWTESH
ncbi:MAG: hypothetical protein EOP87_15475 [Verrucomicrobiaceae bacterium]|nr:MAG: hypothetical protein EOP87_15475 [Verrucomicrobiaceae bacterium]